MAFSSATLSTQLQGISGATEGAAITSWTAAWAAYFAGAVAGSGPGVAFTSDPTAITNARNAMATAMTGLSSSGQGDDKVQAGIEAWWTHIAASPGTYFSGASAIAAPAGLSGIAAALVSIFSTNTAPGVTTAQACDAIAAELHTRNAGGTATIGGSQTIA